MKIENLSWWAGLLEPFVGVVLIPCGGFDSLDLFQLILNFVLIPKTKVNEKAIMFWKLRLKYRRRCVSHDVGNDKKEELGAVIFTVQLKISSGIIMAVFDWFHSRWYPPSTQNHPATYFWFMETLWFFFFLLIFFSLLCFDFVWIHFVLLLFSPKDLDSSRLPLSFVSAECAKHGDINTIFPRLRSQAKVLWLVLLNYAAKTWPSMFKSYCGKQWPTDQLWFLYYPDKLALLEWICLSPLQTVAAIH